MADFNEHKEIMLKNGVNSANELSKALIAHPYHIATVTGDALVVAPDNYSARIAFVDYDGPAAYEDYLQKPPLTEEDKTAFFAKHASRMLQGAETLEQYIDTLS